MYSGGLSGLGCCGMWLLTFIEPNQLYFCGKEFVYNGKQVHLCVVCIKASSYPVLKYRSEVAMKRIKCLG